jgi:hypothetical protein
LKRLFLSRHICTQEVPSLDPHKQFVVAQGPKVSQEQQQARLQMFWYREELLDRIKATWQCKSMDRSGVLDLRSSLRLTVVQLNILKKEDVEFLVSLKGDSVDKLSHRRFSCKCNEYVILNISIRNRFSKVPYLNYFHTCNNIKLYKVIPSSLYFAFSLCKAITTV